MATYETDKHFTNSLRRNLDLIQILKYNLEDLKSLDIHKTLSADKNMKGDCAALLQALNAFLFKLQAKAPTAFGGVMKVMQRDQLHDISLHLDVIYMIDNLSEVSVALQEELNALFAKEDAENIISPTN